MKKFIKEKTLSAQALTESGLPRGFWNFQIDTYGGSQKALQDVLKYLHKFREVRSKNLGLFIRGKEESQKTFLASYLVRALLLQELSVKYVSMPDLVDSILSRELDLKEFLCAAELLVLDNVNKPGNSFWPTALERCLVHRKDYGMPTVVVTQLCKQGSNDEFGAQYGEINLRLIEHLSHTVWAECDEAQKMRAENQRKSIFVEEV